MRGERDGQDHLQGADRFRTIFTGERGGPSIEGELRPCFKVGNRTIGAKEDSERQIPDLACFLAGREALSFVELAKQVLQGVGQANVREVAPHRRVRNERDGEVDGDLGRH